MRKGLAVFAAIVTLGIGAARVSNAHTGKLTLHGVGEKNQVRVAKVVGVNKVENHKQSN